MSLLNVSSRSSLLSCIISTFACGLQLGFYHGAARWPLWPASLATDASLSGPSPPQGACGFSSAADTNRIRDDILPGWRGLSWSNWDGSRRDAGMEEAPLYVPLICIFVLWFQQNYNWIDSVAVEMQQVPDVPQSEFSSIVIKISRSFCGVFGMQPVHIIPFGDFNKEEEEELY